MARPISDTEQFTKAYLMWRSSKNNPGLGPAAITRKLELIYDDPPSLRTVKNWTKKFANIVEDDPELDEPFEWHRLDAVGLPWEAGKYFMDMTLTVCPLWSPFPPTFREARWWWRIHHAAPDLTQFDVYVIAGVISARELAHKLLAEKLDVADLEAWLMYKPWQEEIRNEEYLKAVEEGRIPRLRQPREAYGSRLRTGMMDELSCISLMLAPRPEWPSMTPTYQWDMVLRPSMEAMLEETSAKKKEGRS